MRIETRLSEFLVPTFDPDETLRIAVAYVRTSGVERLRRMAGSALARADVLVGLDDYVTDPDAIQSLRGVCRRVRTITNDAGRFHPKLYWRRTNDGGACYIGSANLTGSALDKNDEAGVVFEYMGPPPDDLATLWTTWWDRGRPAEQTVAGYARSFAEKRSSPTLQPTSSDHVLARLTALSSRPVELLSDGELLELREAIVALQTRVPELGALLRERLEAQGGSRTRDVAGSIVELTGPKFQWDRNALDELVARFGVPRSRVFLPAREEVRPDASDGLRAYSVPEEEIEKCRSVVTKPSLKVLHRNAALRDLVSGA